MIFARKVLVWLILFAFVLCGVFLLSTLVTPARVESITGAAGQFGPLLLGLLLLSTQVFAPLSGTPVMLVSIKLYGYPQSMAVLYVSCLVSSALNFWIARRFGRNLLAKLVGEKTLATIDQLSELNERTLLVSFRVFGYSFFDLVSYAVGLTRISFGKYFAYTALLTLIPFTVQYFLFSRIDFNSFGGMLIYVVSIAAAGAIFVGVLYKVYIQNRVHSSDASRSEAQGQPQ